MFSLQRILGHSPASLEITRRYVRLLDDDLREAHRRARRSIVWACADGLESHLSAGSSVIALSAAIHARTAPAATSREATTWPRADLVRDFGLLTMNQVGMTL